MRQFWNFTDEGEVRTLRIEGQIADETWFGDEVTPQLFKKDLLSGKGDITLWINSPGGDVFAAAQIYNMLMDYKGNVHVIIDGLAASAASVIAMAGTTVSMSPVAMMMIHNPWTFAQGEAKDMAKVIEMLGEIKESIINAYELRTGLSRTKISHLMDSESWFNAKKAVELGFADKVLFEKEETPEQDHQNSYTFSRVTAAHDLVVKLQASLQPPKPQKTIPINQLEKRLNLLK
ncbi:head maturation protease, ClpP-related [Streptococcus constellatus subsp. pharyngis]|jgi:Protease subunit of ATP-dependent Clp proteases|uniref:ATP-dependent Clp protease proteolytic subunit n=1 Tax=Streptococcus constellatus subsp. pharyngis SK1060 = CCUG 46377 TaxID=1035184 RepID=F9P8R4_STRCV|nr:head maturation protease, ClpP-related [Streptococcus constellatus]QBX13710.1 Clp protease-like protein [Streptococcus phage Javan101]QBX13814.1 Clp protease-like protein [Streptococcus phage Javan107]QBX13907.1 Clp protease-like protein [Streptococcus phage Javan113]QBX22928.1 Clp protease-like protein [Streptococcus phage Javan104]AGU72920.1 putative ATP-dependent Clp protease [Streptococcus constellatus subsp. pharyngis C232]